MPELEVRYYRNWNVYEVADNTGKKYLVTCTKDQDLPEAIYDYGKLVFMSGWCYRFFDKSSIYSRWYGPFVNEILARNHAYENY